MTTTTYPDWTASDVYTAGMAASENGIVYKANWWTRGDDPASHNGGPGSGQPWTVVPADPGSTPPSGTGTMPTSGTGTGTTTSTQVAPWSASSIYVGGNQASENGFVYKANWWTQGDEPIKHNGGSGSGQPWTLVGPANLSPTVPNAPTNLSASALSGTSAYLSWDPAVVPGSGTVTGYIVYEDGRQVGAPTGTSFTVSDLSPSTSYAFSVAAVDQTGASPASPAASLTTPSGASAGQGSAVFAPYIDVCLYGNGSLADISRASGIKTFSLGFIQSSGTDTIGWGGIGDLAHDTLPDGNSMAKEIADLRSAGGDAIVSFGGAAGIDPASASTSATSLQAQYQSVLDRYGVRSLDFDVEGAQIANQTSAGLRAKALAGLQKANPDLQVSFTLPVLPSGLTADGVSLLKGLAGNGVRVDLVNVMAMDYGGAVDQGGAMGKDAIDAVKATESQLAGIGLGAKVGVTPMIGVNDVPSEVFGLSDAKLLVDYLRGDPNVTRLSMWSVSRDNGSTAGASYASPTGSGLAQSPYQFSGIFAQV